METKQLKNLFKLSSKVTVYVPSTVDVNKKTSNKKYVERVASELSNYFGGATSTDCLGFWNSQNVGLVKEKTTIVFSYCTTEQLNQHIEEVIALCQQLKNDMKQEAVSLEINGDMYFID